MIIDTHWHTHVQAPALLVKDACAGRAGGAWWVGTVFKKQIVNSNKQKIMSSNDACMHACAALLHYGYGITVTVSVWSPSTASAGRGSQLYGSPRRLGLRVRTRYLHTQAQAQWRAHD